MPGRRNLKEAKGSIAKAATPREADPVRPADHDFAPARALTMPSESMAMAMWRWGDWRR